MGICTECKKSTGMFGGKKRECCIEDCNIVDCENCKRNLKTCSECVDESLYCKTHMKDHEHTTEEEEEETEEDEEEPTEEEEEETEEDEEEEPTETFELKEKGNYAYLVSNAEEYEEDLEELDRLEKEKNLICIGTDNGNYVLRKKGAQ